MTTTMNKVHQSKWGLHPCSREVSKKLRTLNRVYASALHRAGSWERWNRKEPQNRVRKIGIRNDAGERVGYERLPWPEPLVCPVFHSLGKWGVRDNGIGYKILEASRLARTPVATAEDVKPLPISEEEIDRLYEAAREWFV